MKGILLVVTLLVGASVCGGCRTEVDTDGHLSSSVLAPR